jgi:hypothetical protein
MSKNSFTTRVLVFGPTKSEEDSMKWKMNAPSCFVFLTALLLTCGAAAQTKNLEAIATLKFYAAAEGNSFAVRPELAKTPHRKARH